MEHFEVAHVRVQGHNVILIVVHPNFAQKGRAGQNTALDALQMAANQAGLAGTVAVVWNHNGRVASFGPSKWDAFLRSLTWPWIAANINTRLTVE